MKELVIFNKDKKEIDWYSPIGENQIFENNKYIVLKHENGYEYTIRKDSDFLFYEIRDLEITNRECYRIEQI